MQGIEISITLPFKCGHVGVMQSVAVSVDVAISIAVDCAQDENCENCQNRTCQNHENRTAVAPAWQPFMCAECALACVWHNEQGAPDTCMRDHVEKDYSKYLGFSARTVAFYCTAAQRESGIARRESDTDRSERHGFACMGAQF